MKNTYWLEQVHQRLVDGGVPLPQFALSKREYKFPLSKVRLSPEYNDQVNLISEEDLAGNSIIQSYRKEYAQKRLIELIKNIYSEGKISASLEDQSFDIEKGRHFFELNLERLIFPLILEDLEDPTNYRAINSVSFECDSINKKTNRSDNLTIDCNLGYNILSAFIPWYREGHLTSEEAFINAIITENKKEKLQEEQINKLTPQEYIDKAIPLIVNFYKTLESE